MRANRISQYLKMRTICHLLICTPTLIINPAASTGPMLIECTMYCKQNMFSVCVCARGVGGGEDGWRVYERGRGRGERERKRKRENESEAFSYLQRALHHVVGIRILQQRQNLLLLR